MKLSNKSLYAVRALFNMAYHGTNTPTKIDEIATREEVPPRFLEQIFQDLKKAGIVGSKRGPRGGYFLLKAPQDITLRAVLCATEGDATASFRRERESLSDKSGAPTSLHVTAQVWEDIAERINSALDGVTLHDMVQRGEELGVRREGFNEFIYII